LAIGKDFGQTSYAEQVGVSDAAPTELGGLRGAVCY